MNKPTPKHHPDIEWLLDYHAGNMNNAEALCIEAHLDHCPECRAMLRSLDVIAGEVFNSADKLIETTSSSSSEQPEQSSEKQLSLPPIESIYESINKAADRTFDNKSTSADMPSYIPQSLRNTIKIDIKSDEWLRVGSSVSVFRLPYPDPQREVSLIKLAKGGGVKSHDHRAREVTVVLDGSFSDADGVYSEGDFLVREPGEEHAPIASTNKPCVCLSVLSAPIKFTGPLTRLINPFIKIRPLIG